MQQLYEPLVKRDDGDHFDIINENAEEDDENEDDDGDNDDDEVIVTDDDDDITFEDFAIDIEEDFLPKCDID